jgi:uncharacterized protein (TIGR03118 family)
MKTVYVPMIVLVACLGARAQDSTPNSYTQVNLVSDVAGRAANIDANLVNPWGLSRSANTPWWVADEGSGVATVFSGNGTIATRVVTIPPASGTGVGSPTGTVWWGTSFVFATLDGTISQWTSGSQAVIKVNNSSTGAVYTGITVASNGGQIAYYVANSAGGVEAYDLSFAPVTLPAGAFVDPNVPAGYTPYGIQLVGATLWVTFTNAPGAGNGYVDAFSPAGTLLLSLQHGSWMNQPWGIALSPSNFGRFSYDLLVGNTGSGQIAAFSPTTGAYLGILESAAGTAIRNSGLWAIYFGGGGSSGPLTTLYFTAGIGGYKKGLFGAITANPE